MPEILYSDIEVTAKVVMDPHTMEKALADIDELFDACESGCRETHSALYSLSCEMRSVLSRLAEMHVI